MLADDARDSTMREGHRFQSCRPISLAVIDTSGTRALPGFRRQLNSASQEPSWKESPDLLDDDCIGLP